MLGVDDEISAEASNVTLADVQAQGGLSEWAPFLAGVMDKVVAGAVYKHTGLATVPSNTNNRPVTVDPWGNTFEAGKETIINGVRTVGAAAKMNTGVLVAVLAGVGLVAYLIWKK